VNLVAHAVILLFIVVFLFALQPLAAIGAAALFGGTYGLIFLAVKRPLTRMGRERIEANREKFQVMQEAMGGIKNVKLMNLEESYVDRLHVPAYRQARNQAAQAMISELPRNLLEVIAFGGMILFTLWLLVMQGGRIHNIIPILGVYAFAAARIFPNIQKVFASVSTIRFGQPALEQLHADLTGPPPDSFTRGATGPQIHLRDRLELDDVTFRFPGSETPALDGLTMTIRANTAVGIVGATGAGKTTTVDLILGLLSTQEGALRIDGQEIGPHNVRAWQKSVGYVPQDIFLIDDTVSANIAFGSPPGKIDHEAVRRAARMAALDEFVREQLPEGYDTRVGERGTRLSGGQRQRIGIARALYTDPDILVFDEATSALDTITERAVIDAVRTIGRTKTIIMIAHRLMTVRDCDEIFLLERGRLAAQGSYDDLVERHAGFRALHQGAA
jgi:ABC-type multidrug transport system fused ATPase/permease subunit